MTNFEVKENINVNIINNNCDNNNGTNNTRNVNTLNCQSRTEQILNHLNNIIQDTDNILGNHINDKSEEKFNSFLQKEMEIEKIQYGEDNFLFADLDSVTLGYDIKNKDAHKNLKSEITLKNKKRIKELNPLNLNHEAINKNSDNHNILKIYKSLETFSLNSKRNNNITYDRDSIFDIKKTPTIRKKGIRKIKRNIDANKSPSVNKIKNKIKRNNKLSHNVSKDGKSLRSLL